MENKIIEEQIISSETEDLLRQKSNEFPFQKLHGAAYGLDIRPTQSLLQKWLREKYKKHIDINPFYYKGDFISWNLRIHNTYYKDKYNSYEEALEIGLQEVLKLI